MHESSSTFSSRTSQARFAPIDGRSYTSREGVHAKIQLGDSGANALFEDVCVDCTQSGLAHLAPECDLRAAFPFELQDFCDSIMTY